jgi:hypothetical protein
MKNLKISALTILLSLIFLTIILQAFYTNFYKGYTKFFNNERNSSLTYMFTTYIIENFSSIASQKIELINRLKESETLCKSFMLSKMVTNEGAVYSTFKQGYKESTVYGINHEVTAESIGLLMLYAVKEGNKPLFDMEVAFLKEKLLSPLGICYWKLKEDFSPFIYNGYFSSASIDDLRIIDALIEGYNLWKDMNYISLIYIMMNGVFNYEVDEATNILVDYYVWKNSESDMGKKAEILTLAYARLPTLLKMAKFESRWIKVFNETLKVVLEGLNSQQSLFYQEYNVKNKEYKGVYFNTIEELMIALNLVEIGKKDKALLIYDFYKKAYLKEGFISDIYRLNGEASPSDAGIGSYALLARLSLKLNDYDFALKIIFEKILTCQEKNSKSEYYGAFMNEWPIVKDANAYDNLQALLTLRETIKALNETK